MGYMKIPNLYKDQSVLMFRECYALEKVHGTSAHVLWEPGAVRLHHGGAKREQFEALFDVDELVRRFTEHFPNVKVCVYGEAYGGKCQGMSKHYGPDLKFVAFEVRIGETWLRVTDAHSVACKLGLDFVPYERISTSLDEVDRARDAHSGIAHRNGMGDKIREGVVLRPLEEFTKNNSARVMAKHKRDEFMETATPRKVDPNALETLRDAKAVAEEWVTEMRLTHVADAVQARRLQEAETLTAEPLSIEDTGDVIRAMVEDVKVEGAGEIEWSPAVQKAVGKKAAALWKAKVAVV